MIGIWSCKTVTIDVPEGTTLSDLVEKLQTIKWDTPNLVVPQNISLCFGEKTQTEVDNHYKGEKDGGK